MEIGGLRVWISLIFYCIVMLLEGIQGTIVVTTALLPLSYPTVQSVARIQPHLLMPWLNDDCGCFPLYWRKQAGVISDAKTGDYSAFNSSG